MSGALAAVAVGGGLMPSFQAVGALVATTATGIAVAWPAHQANDIGLLIIAGRGGTISEGTSGWAHVTNSPVSASGSDLGVLWKRAASGAEADAEAILTTDDVLFAVIVTFRNCAESGDPFEAVNYEAESATATHHLDTVTTTSFNTLIAMIAARFNDASGAAYSGWTNAALANVTERFDDGTTTGSGGGIGIATGEHAAAGATGVGTVTVNVSTSGLTATVALKPK